MKGSQSFMNKFRSLFLTGSVLLVFAIAALVQSHHAEAQTKYKMGFILLTTGKANTVDLAKVRKVADVFSTAFSSATYNLMSMDATASVVSFPATKDMLIKDASGQTITGIDYAPIMKRFYASNNDTFDFVSVLTDFPVPSADSHNIVKNTIKGIGLQTNDDTALFGSHGFLKGLNFGGYIDLFAHNASNDEINLLVVPMLHETGHQWCCYVGDPFQGNGTAKLEIRNQNSHYYSGLDNTPWLDPMSEGDGQFAPNGDGTFKSITLPNIKPLSLYKYNNFSLYLMGVLDKSKFAQKYSIYNVGDYTKWPYMRATFYKTISVNDIIAVEGNRVDSTQPASLNTGSLSCSVAVSGGNNHDVWTFTGSPTGGTLPYTYSLKNVGYPGGPITINQSSFTGVPGVYNQGYNLGVTGTYLSVTSKDGQSANVPCSATVSAPSPKTTSLVSPFSDFTAAVGSIIESWFHWK